jgi:hypothetical protein
LRKGKHEFYNVRACKMLVKLLRNKNGSISEAQWALEVYNLVYLYTTFKYKGSYHLRSNRKMV